MLLNLKTYAFVLQYLCFYSPIPKLSFSNTYAFRRQNLYFFTSVSWCFEQRNIQNPEKMREPLLIRKVDSV